MVRPDYTAPNCLKATVKKVIDISPFGLRNGKQKKVLVLLLYRLRDSVSPVCEIFILEAAGGKLFISAIL